MNHHHFLSVAEDLELAGLLWRPEIGDEVTDKRQKDLISIFVDSQGLSLDVLRSSFLWLPTVEQLVQQFEARQAILFHAGFELNEKSMCYKTVIQASIGHIEKKADSLRLSMGLALRDLLLADSKVVN
jgi:hypothetical protein